MGMGSWSATDTHNGEILYNMIPVQIQALNSEMVQQLQLEMIPLSLYYPVTMSGCDIRCLLSKYWRIQHAIVRAAVWTSPSWGSADPKSEVMLEWPQDRAVPHGVIP